MKESVALKESGETYLETILLLQKKLGNVRSIDVAHELNYSKPSISRAMSILKDKQLISIDTNGHIQLTKEGREKAENVVQRHKLITEFLKKSLSLDPDIAESDACKIEHIISEEAIEKIKLYLNYNGWLLAFLF